MGFPVTINGHTYLESDFTGYGYKTALPSMINDTATVASAVAAYVTDAYNYSVLSSQWATLTTGIVGSTDYSSKAWAIGGTGVTNASGKGAAKEWAIKTTGTVDGTDYSAKYYSQAAATSASSAASLYDAFDDRYLGSKSSDPTLDNDGNALLTGALYWNTVSNAMKTYNGSSWVSVLSNSVIANSSTPALTITQTGTGHCLLVEDSASTDSTPFVIDANGNTVIGGTSAIVEQFSGTGRFTVVADNIDGYYTIAAANFTADNNGPIQSFLKSRSATVGHTIVQNNDTVAEFRFQGSDGTGYIQAASIKAQIDGTPGTNDMPGRLVFSTTKDGESSPTEALRIDSAQRVGIGGAASAGYSVQISKNVTGGSLGIATHSSGVIQNDVTSEARYFSSFAGTAAASFTVANLKHFTANQGTIGSGSSITNQFGFHADSSLTSATNNYGFYSNIASGTGRWNFYAAGTARNYFAGGLETVAGSTGMTSGFTHVPSAAGAPTGAPTNPSGNVPLYYDTTNNRLYVYNGAWKYAQLA